MIIELLKVKIEYDNVQLCLSIYPCSTVIYEILQYLVYPYSTDTVLLIRSTSLCLPLYWNEAYDIVFLFR